VINALAAWLVVALLGAPSPQGQQPAQPLKTTSDDGKRAADLAARGRRIDGTQVVVWMPSTVSEAEHRALVARLDRGVAALRDVIGRHAWQVVRDEKITYYISDDRFVSHATARGAVFIPMARLEDGRAPLLHEAAHELLSTAKTSEVLSPTSKVVLPVWFSEGIADYVAQFVVAKHGLTDGDVFAVGGLDGVDRTCAERLKGPAGSDVLPFIGAPDAPGALYTTDRAKIAPTFYACGFSFTKFIVERVGLAPVILAEPLIDAESVHRQLEKLLGQSLSAARTEWLRAIGYRE
jgi:hypothetical protein